MTKAEELFHEIAATIPNAQEGKMFGSLCIKMANGKAAVIFKDDNMVFKLEAEEEAIAMKIPGASVFAPMKDRPMKGWTSLPYKQAKKWEELAHKAAEYVATIEVKKKKPKK